MLTVPGVPLWGWSIMPLNQIHNMINRYLKIAINYQKISCSKIQEFWNGLNSDLLHRNMSTQWGFKRFQNLDSWPWWRKLISTTMIYSKHPNGISIPLNFRSSLDEKQMHTRLDVRLLRTESNGAVFFGSSCF